MVRLALLLVFRDRCRRVSFSRGSNSRNVTRSLVYLSHNEQLLKPRHQHVLVCLLGSLTRDPCESIAKQENNIRSFLCSKLCMNASISRCLHASRTMNLK